MKFKLLCQRKGHINGHIKKNLYALQAGNEYYLTAGIEYSNEAYVWIAQSEITATPSGAVSHSSRYSNVQWGPAFYGVVYRYFVDF